MKSAISGAIAIVVAVRVDRGAVAQVQETGVPRDAQGRVRTTAPPPRTPDGKPDLSGNLDESRSRPVARRDCGDRWRPQRPGEDSEVAGHRRRDPGRAAC